MRSNFLKLIILLFLLSLPLFLLVQKISDSEEKSLISPLPRISGNILPFFGKPFSPYFAASIWLPNEKAVVLSSTPKPEISGRASFVIDLKDDKALFEKNSRTRYPVASTIKIMTAIIALENADPNQKMVVSKKAAEIGEDSMGLSEGEKMRLRDLLYGLMLVSGNDTAETIAEGIAKNQENFVELMNQKAEILGLTDTRFVNPSGLDGDGEHYSTAYDLVVIAHYAWYNFPLFREIVGTRFYEILATDEHKYYFLENQTNLLTSYLGVKGIKPGFTPEAGLCLVTLAENGGREVLGVVIGSEDRRGDMKRLLDYSFQTLGISVPQS